MESNQAAARAAKRFLDERTRTDWAFPLLPPPRDSGDEEVRCAVAFRERYYGESETGSLPVAKAEFSPDAAYKFDSPDAIGDAVGRTRERKRKRRRMRLEEEMAENEGLRIWVQRRDAWTGAASVRRYGPEAEADTTAQDVEPDTFDLVPVAPRLLPTNAIRASITPKSYPDIYAKIVSSSRTPSVPINLADMTRALVQGWKDTNEWPPKIGALDPLAGRRRGAGAVLGGGAGREGAGFIHRHPHLEKGVGSVRKILHLDGGHGEA
ncbi:uncharacterized protein M421DRAFT_71913 [Didymella exigua CBS 183.55]|uniref:Gag1-like clamp domain-containing protein n=1 Tax=Didymella exigua CBS 183.55 TaxID=1150837 RepID=A0A6A5RBR1_9PLEO|nr:uncharacterized protein M421DRAFT_71913 [Didymella exigua CBS 183.55]KAF1924720.1 hypothetical protein M421DRAFT_71913 [Didymella exigua CBS 183.55]